MSPSSAESAARVFTRSHCDLENIGNLARNSYKSIVDPYRQVVQAPRCHMQSFLVSAGTTPWMPGICEQRASSLSQLTAAHPCEFFGEELPAIGKSLDLSTEFVITGYSQAFGNRAQLLHCEGKLIGNGLAFTLLCH